jgi:hypothetical protein
VGVKIPLRMPPMMMNTVSRAQNASTRIASARRGGIISPLGKFLRRAINRTRAIRQRPSRKPGMAPARKRSAIEIVPPAASE